MRAARLAVDARRVGRRPGGERGAHGEPRRGARRRHREGGALGGVQGPAARPEGGGRGRDGDGQRPDPDHRAGPGPRAPARDPQRDAAATDGTARSHRRRSRGRRRLPGRRRLLPPAAARGGRPQRDRGPERGAAARAAGACRRPHGLPRGAGALHRRARPAHPPRRRRGRRPRRARAAAGRRLRDRDHGQRHRRDLRRARRADRARGHLVLRRGAALPDDRPDRLHRQPARGRVEPDGRRPPAAAASA